MTVCLVCCLACTVNSNWIYRLQLTHGVNLSRTPHDIDKLGFIRLLQLEVVTPRCKQLTRIISLILFILGIYNYSHELCANALLIPVVKPVNLFQSAVYFPGIRKKNGTNNKWQQSTIGARQTKDSNEQKKKSHHTPRFHSLTKYRRFQASQR